MTPNEWSAEGRQLQRDIERHLNTIQSFCKVALTLAGIWGGITFSQWLERMGIW
jgi:hypothetical protein